jgi:hypothetical protein
MINFDNDLDEIVQVDGIGLVTLRKALACMPEKVGPFGVLYRRQGKIPALFDQGKQWRSKGRCPMRALTG